MNLNHRQRLILGRALRNPDAEFRIGYHKTNHGITYVTVRKDLLGLVAAGYLSSRKIGKRLVFSPAPGLKKKVSGSGRPRE